MWTQLGRSLSGDGCNPNQPPPSSPHSQEKQEADQDEDAASGQHPRAPQPARPGHPQEHVPAGAHHAVRAQGHRARDHLLGLRRHAAGLLLQAHDHPEQAGGAAGHLRCQVGQVAAR